MPPALPMNNDWSHSMYMGDLPCFYWWLKQLWSISLLDASPEGSMLHAFFTQFTHHPWNGLRFWDLIQPFFMFIVGVAMPFSLNRRMANAADRSKAETYTIEGYNSRVGHYLARFRRKSKCYGKAEHMIEKSLNL